MKALVHWVIVIQSQERISCLPVCVGVFQKEEDVLWMSQSMQSGPLVFRETKQEAILRITGSGRSVLLGTMKSTKSALADWTLVPFRTQKHTRILGESA